MCSEKKVCISCNEIKTIDNFHFRKDLNSYRNQCKLCLKNKVKKEGMSSKDKEHNECINRWLGYETEIFKVIEYVGYFKRNNEKYPRRWFKYKCKFCENIEISQVNRLLKLADAKMCRLCKCSYNKNENLKRCSVCLEWKPCNEEHFNFFPSLQVHNKKTPPTCKPCLLVVKKKTRDKRAQNGKEKEYRDSIKGRTNKRRKERYDNDYEFKLSVNIRNSINQAFRLHGFKKNSKVSKLLCCNWDVFKNHLQEQFTEGMTWELMGKEIHIDHKIPLSSAKTKKELESLFHYTNLQPLWGKYNLMKNGKILTDEEIDKLRSLPRPK